MRGFRILGIILVVAGLYNLAITVLGPTVVSRALERGGFSVQAAAEDCGQGTRQVRGFALHGVLALGAEQQVLARHGHIDEVCVPGPECGREASEVLLFEEGNGLFRQCRARSVLGVFSAHERRHLFLGLALLLLGLVMAFGGRLRRAWSERRWRSVMDASAE